MDGAISKQEQDQVFATRDQSHAEHEQLKLLFNKLKPLLNSNRHWLKQQQVIYI